MDQTVPQPNKIEGFFGEYSFLSNFFESTITPFDGITYPTVEHAYQAFKSDKEEVRKKISSLTTPGQAKKYGSKLPIKIDLWDTTKQDVMFYLVRLKFEIPDLRTKLIAVPYPTVFEETNFWGDTFWGVCNGFGANRLGNILGSTRGFIELSDETRAEQLAKQVVHTQKILTNYYTGEPYWKVLL